MRAFSWVLFVLGVVWVLFGGLGTAALISTQSPDGGLWRAPFTLLLGIGAVVWSRRIRSKPKA